MAQEIKPTDIRKPVSADRFYPGNKNKLIKQIDDLLSNTTSSRIDGQIRGIIAPHAAYVYSGSAAAEAYIQLKNRHYDVVAVIAATHYHETIRGVSVFNGAAYQTALGLVPVAQALANALIRRDDKLISTFSGHRQEHSLEIQLPFLQTVLSEFQIIPIVVLDQDYELYTILGENLAQILAGKNALIVASSDLSHYHSDALARKLDSVTIEHIKNFDYQGLADDLSHDVCEACGGGPMISAMIACEKLGAKKVEILKYMTSGDVMDFDKSRVVGYLSAAMYQAA
ncbi:AmmeMemoRadiSam system protein B [candidate division KSB1 bacterium]|nr:AmmeMemoRadiSam system protein B [candidate division KSB1 bacterium]